MRLRLEADIKEECAKSLRVEMEKALDELELMKGESSLLKLLRAECCLFGGEKSKAALFLDESRDEILAQRQEKKEIYCYYQYLRLEIQPDEYQRESLVRLMKKYLEEDHSLFYLFVLLGKSDKRCCLRIPLQCWLCLDISMKQE